MGIEKIKNIVIRTVNKIKTKKSIKNLVFSMMLLINILSFSEVPHSYVADNPNKAVTTAETIKRREQAEMNIGVTKVKTQEIEGVFDIKNKMIIVEIPELEAVDKIIITDNLRELNSHKNPSLLKNQYTYDFELPKLKINHRDKIVPKELFIIGLSQNNEMKFLKKIILNKKSMKNIRDWWWEYYPIDMEISSDDYGKEIETDIETTWWWGYHTLITIYGIYVNGVYTPINSIDIPTRNVTIGETVIEISHKTKFSANGQYKKLVFKVISSPKTSFTLRFEVKARYWEDFGCIVNPDDGVCYDYGGYYNQDYYQNFNFKYVNKTLQGTSRVRFVENYPTTTFVPFNGVSLDTPVALALESAVTGVTLEATTGHGIATMLAGDVLEINGVQSTVGASGNLTERTATIGTLAVNYMTQAGKLRIRPTTWAVGEPQRNLAIRVLRGGNEIVNHTMTIVPPKRIAGTSRVRFVENYPTTTFVPFNGVSLDTPIALTLESAVTGVTLEATTGHGIATMVAGDILEINGTQATVGASGNLTERTATIGTLAVNYMTQAGKLRIRSTTWAVGEPQRNLAIRVLRGGNEIVNHTMTIVPPKRIAGTSRVRFVENYPTTTFVPFNGVSLDTPVALALESAVTGVTLEATTGHGIATMLVGDILEINGTQVTVGASGNVAERTGSMGTLDFTYKVESGKLRLQLNNWGVLEARRDIVVRVIRGTNEISRHTLETVAPRKVEGTTGLKYDETYQIRSQVKFNGIDLNTPLDVSLENLQGVTVVSKTGAGIPFMNQGDMLFIGDNLRRGEMSYTIGTSGNLENRNIKVTNGEVGLSVDGGKLRLSLNNWTVNKDVNLNVRIVRGTNQIMQHTFNLAAPTAPFNVVQSGVLDFGTIIAGVKNRTAETDIKIEMIADVSSIEFKLNTDSPELVNTSGDILRAKDLRTVVRKQGDKTYLVKIQGRLDVPENQGLGEYSGTAIVEMLIR